MNEPELDIAWDPSKADSHRGKHGVDFPEAASVLLDPLALTVFDAAHSQDEDRWFTLGRTGSGKLLAMSHTYQPTGTNKATVRIISARMATRNERQQYENLPR